MSVSASSTRLRTRLTRVAAAAVSSLLAVTLGQVVAAAPAHAANRATPGSFTGYGFDQCLAPSQQAMDAWLRSSPFWAVGIYISGASRACPSQPNLTPTWISTQLRSGWRLLPITLGPQASCTTRERYLQQERISPNRTNRYARARTQAREEAAQTVQRAQRLGISRGSTLWYDLEAFDTRPTDCRESALSFLSAWTTRLHALGYVSGVYSSAASGIAMLDDARANRPGAYAMPDQVWIADWNGRAEVHSSYVRRSGWMPHQRVHQYRGGHNETHGGVTINIDSNWLDVGRGTTAPAPMPVCGGTRLDFADYPMRRPGSSGDLVKAGQCLLSRSGHYDGAVNGTFNAATADAVRSFRAKAGMPAGNGLTRATWTALLSRGNGYPLMKVGSGSRAVRRLQRALNAADGAGLPTSGVFGKSTAEAVRRYQGDHGLSRTGVVLDPLWGKLTRGLR